MSESSSDEEGEIRPQYVDEYFFVDQEDTPISFTILPVKWQEEDLLGDSAVQVYLRGTADCGRQIIYKRVIAWKFELSYTQPEISVLSAKKNWITLQRPRNCFKDIVRTILITIHGLHFIKRNPEALANHVWNHLLKAFSSFDVEPSAIDLSDHIVLISEAAKRDKDLVKSKNLLAILEKPSETTSIHEDARSARQYKFIVDGEEDDENGNEDDEQMDMHFAVCSICDNGGSVLCCEGRCLRSFHPTVADGVDTACESLGFTDGSQFEGIRTFLCKNCSHKQHQCYACGELGSSDESSSQEVFPCFAANCGHFYHPECISKLLHADDKSKEKDLRAKIAMRESFFCSLHKCFVCKLGENMNVHELQFAICRRCPRAYHRKCLPREIILENKHIGNELTRAWEDLLPYKRILIYCLDHEIVRELGTPARDHLIFPDVDGKKRTRTLGSLSVGDKNTTFKRKSTSISNVAAKTVAKKPKQPEKVLSLGGVEKRCLSQYSDHLKKRNINNVGRNYLKEKGASSHSIRTADDILSLTSHKQSVIVGLPACKVRLQDKASNKINRTAEKPVQKKIRTSPTIAHPEIEKQISALMEEVSSSFNYEEFIKSQDTSDICAYRNRNGISKTFTLGLVQTQVHAARTALKMCEEGHSEDARAICGPAILLNLIKLKRRLEIRLAPFLHGMRYTSFGRHFTKQEKLKEIVDRLHWYAQNGDTIVDFCCGSNDFSCLMKEKLEKTGKSCSFRNFDLIQPKNTFNFEKRDWMSVNVEELPNGSQLIMGLNPPFGIRAALANKFIRKALEFNPKLIILIVPKETRRLDKIAAYDLIWEDEQIVSGKSFYLPGSVDVHDKQLEQWNMRTPPLYLWSRRDWTRRHKAIAQEQGHQYGQQREMLDTDHNLKIATFNYLMEDNHDGYGDFSMNVHATSEDISTILEDIPKTNDNELDPVEVEVNAASKCREEHFLGYENTEFMHSHASKSDNDPHPDGMLYKEWGKTEKLGDDDMCVDMDLGTPITSPTECNGENRPPQACDTSTRSRSHLVQPQETSVLCPYVEAANQSSNWWNIY